MTYRSSCTFSIASTCLCAPRLRARGDTCCEDGDDSTNVVLCEMVRIVKVEERAGIIRVCGDRLYKHSESRQLAAKPEAWHYVCVVQR